MMNGNPFMNIQRVMSEYSNFMQNPIQWLAQRNVPNPQQAIQLKSGVISTLFRGLREKLIEYLMKNGKRFNFGSIAYKDKACIELQENGSNPFRTVISLEK